MISVNEISPQRIQALEDEVAVLKKMIYDLNGKAVRDNSLSGTAIIAKTVNGDRITGGIVEGSLLKTINAEIDNSGNYAFLQKQWAEFALNNNILLEIGIVDNASGNPVIHFYHPDGSNYFSIWGSNTDNFIVIGGTGTEVRANGTWNFDNAKINGVQVATLNDIPTP